MTHRYTHEAVHTWRVEARGRPRGAKRKVEDRGEKKENKARCLSCTWQFGLAYGVRDGLKKTSVALCSCCYCCLGYRSQVFFVAISTS